MRNRRKHLAKGNSNLKFFAPIGAVPPEDKDLEQRIAKLSPNANISDVLKEITRWEDTAVRKFKEQEKTTTSGRLNTICR
jgi:hypothetical protein